jgi:hypothetical protein
MKQLLKVAVLSTFCSLALTACNERPEIHFKPLAIPADKIDCAALIKRPPLTEEYQMRWDMVQKAPDKEVAILIAQTEFKKFLYSIREREGQVTNYIMNIEGILYGCSSDAEWMRDYTKKAIEG